MKPFDLEAAKRGDPIINKYGFECYFIGVNKNGYVVCEIEGGHLIHYHDTDLFMAPKKRTVWVNLWHSGHYDARDTEAAADDMAYTTFGERVGGKAYLVEIEE